MATGNVVHMWVYAHTHTHRGGIQLSNYKGGTFATAQINLGGAMLSEISQEQDGTQSDMQTKLRVKS